MRTAWLRGEDGSTGRLLQLCAAYFLCYVVTGVSLKYFQGPVALGFPGISETAFLVYSTGGGCLLCLVVVFARGWHRFEGSWRLALPIVPSGICTAIVIPTTTVIYSLPISVMVAMVIMRGSIIVVSRLVDEVQIRQGLLTKTVVWEENVAVGFSLGAVAVHLWWEPSPGLSPTALWVLGFYVGAYAVRIYLMNWFKNRGLVGLDNRTWFGIEQLVATCVLALALAAAMTSGSVEPFAVAVREAVVAPHAAWRPATLAGTVYGLVAFFSVFIFMYKGRTATFAGLVNRLTSLVAGTVATLIFALVFGGKYPKSADWLSLGFILVAVAFLTRAERRRVTG
ncbi:MAG: hypothetical protein EXR71_20360 [Myxococcales bacterium]|nr:hypothetical protein [Myxococcales bacterium]